METDPMRAFYCDHFALPLPVEHAFPMAKYRRLRERIIAEGVLEPADLCVPAAATWDQIALVHTPEYVRAVAEGSLPPDVQRRIGFPWSPGLVERSRRSVGGTVAAARAALDDGASASLAGGTHHAFRDRGEGYCVFNDVAVAARVVQAEGRAGRVVVIDCDVHQGNGTASVFRNDPTVTTFSIHGANNYPARKEESDLDVTLPDGTGDAEYLASLRQALDRLFAGPPFDLAFYVAGADPYRGDRFGRLRLTVDGLAERDRLVVGRCHDGRTPLAVTMGGGYARDVETIVTIHLNTIRALTRA
jgi:acetoin utilization deacetylase AcuC-like enzyme